MSASTRILVVTAVAAERDAVLAGRPSAVGMVEGLEVHRAVTAAGLLDVVCGGVGPVAAAVTAASVLRKKCAKCQFTFAQKVVTRLPTPWCMPTSEPRRRTVSCR